MPANASRYPSDLPIPTYEEAVSSSRSHSPALHPGDAARGSDSERQGFLRSENQDDAPWPATGRSSTRRQRDGGGNYHAPTVESARSSFESGFTEPDDGEDEDTEELRRDLEQMDVQDPQAERRAQQRAWFSKQLQNIQGLLSSIHLPSGPSWRMPSMAALQERMPFLHAKPNWPIVARLVGLFVIVALVYALLVVKVFRPASVYAGSQFMPESVKAFVQRQANSDRLRELVRELSFVDHMAGTRGDTQYLAPKIKAYFEQAGLEDVYNDDYQVFLNFPRRDGRKVSIINPPELRWEAPLEEDIVTSNSSDHNQQLSFHGLSRSGQVTGPLVYANYGSRADFKFLADQGIDIVGTVVLMRYYGFGESAASRVRNAELAGAIGCLIYSDPADDGFKRGQVWPEGRWRTGDAVQRGSVALTGWVVGDVLTPGWASTGDAERISKDSNPGLVNIPSLPLAWNSARTLLLALQGHGPVVPENWIPEIPFPEGDGGSRFTGDKQTSPIVEIQNVQDEVEQQPIRNILGRIQGIEDPDQLVYVGNHRDAWCYGAVDASSGTAALLEVIRIFGELVELGWRPRRTIVFASWDGTEYNLIGSTEHVEERLNTIRPNGVAYINVDVGVSGPDFRAAASPVFQTMLLRNLDRIMDLSSNRTLKEVWTDNNQFLERLTAKSDYVPFQSLAGVASMDIGFHGPLHGYPAHSCYETSEWMERYGDPDFEVHAMLVQLWALLVLDVADEPLVGLDLNLYAWAVAHDIEDLIGEVADLTRDTDVDIDFTHLQGAVALFTENARQFHEWEQAWENDVVANEMIEARETAILRISHNKHASYFDTNLLDVPGPTADGQAPQRQGGPPSRPQFKHVIYGPPREDGISKASFPAVRDAIEDGDWRGVQTYVDVAAERIRFAADKLIN